MNKLLTNILLFINIAAFAQVNVTGKVVDKETKTPIGFAEVVLIQEEPYAILGAVTDMKGTFDVKATPGKYRMQISYVGQTLFTKDLVVEKDIDFGTLEVESVTELDEVIVEGRRLVIERKIDRLVFDVENSSKSSQGDALEVLRITPGVRVQNDEVTIIGKSGLGVMIDNKLVQLSDEDLANFLKSISSEDIKNIEVITTPPAKYEAEGNSGLINITLKEGKKNSWNAGIKASYLQRRYGTTATGGNFNYNKNNLSIASSVYYRNGVYYQEQDDYAYFPDGIWYTSSPFRSDIEGINARLDIAHQVTPRWSMGGQYLYNKTNYIVTDAPYTPVYSYGTENTEIIRSLQSVGRMDITPEIHSFNYNNEVLLDTLGRTITLNLDYFTYENPDIKVYDGVSVIQEPYRKQYYAGTNTNIQEVDNISGKLDIDLPTSWANISFGTKISRSESINDILLFNSGLVDVKVTEQDIDMNDFEYEENIQAIYFSVNKQLSQRWSIQAGLRTEATQTHAVSQNLSLDEENDYTKLFPTLYISFASSETSVFNFNYSKRLERPQFFALNPNLYFINPFQTIEGNPFLQPAFIDNLELTHTYDNLISKVYFSYEDNLFAQVPLPNPDNNIIRFTNENYINTQRVGISENYIFDRIDRWSSNNSVDINYVKSSFNLPEGQQQPDLEGINTRISTYNDFQLNSSGTVLLGLNYWYSFPGVDGIFDTKSASSLSTSLQFLLLEKNLNISIIGNDLFKDAAERTTTTINGVYQEARYYYDTRSILVSVSYRFGNNDISAKRHTTGNEDERGRTGN